MKKFLLGVSFLLAALSVKAQEMYIGGAISLWHNDSQDMTAFTVAPDFGVELNPKWAVGAELSFSHNHAETGNTNAFALAPYARYSFYENKIVRLFVDMGLGFSTSKKKYADSENGFEIGLKPGMAIKLNDSFSLITKVGFAGYRDDYFRGENGCGVTLNGEDLEIGIDYEF